MPAELPPATTTTVFDVAATSPRIRIWSVKDVVKTKWRSKGALILYAALALSLLGYKLFGPGGAPRNAGAAAAAAPSSSGDETRQLMARLQAASKARTAAKAAEEKPAARTAEKPARSATAGAVAPVASSAAAAGKKPSVAAMPTTATPAPAMATSATPTTRPVASATTKAPLATTRPADALGSLYIDDTNGFSIRFPAGWLIRTFDGDPWVIDVGDGRVALISVGFAPFPDGFTAESIPPDWIAKKIKRKADTTLHAQGYAMISGRKALWSKSTGPLPMSNSSPRMTRVNYILPLGDGRVLELRVAASPEQFDRLVPVMRKSVETFVLQTPHKREPMASAQ